MDPGLADPVPDAAEDGPPAGRAMLGVAALAGRRGSRLGRAALWVFSTLFAFVLSVAAWDFVTSLFTSNRLLGWVAFVLVLLAVLFALALAGREAMGFARLARLDHLRKRAEAAHRGADLREARAVAAAVAALYRARPEAAWGLARHDEAAPHLMDADAALDLAEAEILRPLDALARAEIESASRRVATVTALVPLALADVAVALYANLAMIRRIAEIYGGRAGSLGSWSLLRRVFASLLAAGAVALADDLIGSVAGGGVLSKLSRRFGEGVVNGALTARVGVAAMDLCRPLPFRALPRPAVSALVSRALAGLVPRGAGGGAAGGAGGGT
ncbi:TIGR01620 family protein [Pseudogemmobacter sonorensis]|uniref:TIGR01620 family protein n=1 Tax=Pseudogemmobacter sonorensis TaxID=2989681 RepID=UPI0036A3D4E9